MMHTAWIQVKLFVLRAMHLLLRHFAAWDKAVYQRIEALTKRIAASAVEEADLPTAADDPLFENIRLITHAGGGLSGLSYLNCTEAYPVYYQMGNRVFEYDVEEDGNGVFLLTHNGDGKSLIDERFHPMPIGECLENLKGAPDSAVIFDCKFPRITAFCGYLRSQLTRDELQRVVVQVFNEANIREARSAGIRHLLYVCMMTTDYREAAALCVKYGINAVSISEEAIRERTGWEVFTRCGIHIYAYTVNTIDWYKKLQKRGVYGVFSDFLTQKEIDAAM